VSSSPAADAVDARGDRVVEALIGVALLGAFVFRVPLLLPILALLVGAGAVAGPRANVFQVVVGRFVVPRLHAPEVGFAPEVRATTVRAQDALIAMLCALAAAAYVGVSGLGWLIAIAAAVVAIVAATTGVHLGERLLGRYL
jgi:divalent metal cation (Fe/Co/Zn/Cd) transporter